MNLTIMNINEYIKSKNIYIKEPNIFRELWTSVYNNDNILITPKILIFLNILKENDEYINFYKKKKEFIRFLIKNKINFNRLNFNNPKLNSYNIPINDLEKYYINYNLYFNYYITISFKNLRIYLKKKKIFNRIEYLNQIIYIKKQYKAYLINAFPFLTIDLYSKLYHYKMYKNYIFKKYFLEIWNSIFLKQNIVLDINILQFIFSNNSINQSNSKNYINILKNLLNRYKIPYEKIYYENISDEPSYNIKNISDDIKNNYSNVNCLNNYSWIILSNNNFKKLIMLLNNNSFAEIKNSYIEIENLSLNYTIYMFQYNEIKYKNIQK